MFVVNWLRNALLGTSTRSGQHAALGDALAREEIWTTPDVDAGALGEGGFTTVRRGTYRGSDVAVKLFTHNTENAESVFLAEVECLKEISGSSPLIIGFYGALYSEPRALVLQLCEGGDMSRAFKGNREQLSLGTVLMWYREISTAVRIVHRANWCHRDLKCSNFLLSKGHAILGDFGLARRTLSSGRRSLLVDSNGKYSAFGDETKLEIRPQVVLQSGAAGTWFWMAPEQLEGRTNIDSSIDTWSFGVALFEMFARYDLKDSPPFEKHGTKNGGFFRTPKLEEQWETSHSGITHLIKMCWAYEPIHRISDDALIQALVKLEQTCEANSPLP